MAAPVAAFPAVWTPLYALIALNAANLVLVRRAWRADRLAGLALLPYAAWTGFATALNASIAARNPLRSGR